MDVRRRGSPATAPSPPPPARTTTTSPNPGPLSWGHPTVKLSQNLIQKTRIDPEFDPECQKLIQN